MAHITEFEHPISKAVHMYVCRRDVHFAKSVIVILDNEKRKKKIITF
jgi:hypothetical protein